MGKERKISDGFVKVADCHTSVEQSIRGKRKYNAGKNGGSSVITDGISGGSSGGNTRAIRGSGVIIGVK